MPAIALPVALAGLAATATSSVVGGISQQRQADYSANLLEQEAKLNEAETADRIAQQQVEDKRARALAQATSAAAGYDATSGTGANLLEEIQKDQDISIGNIMYQGQVAAYKSREQAKGYRNAGDNALFNGILGGAGNLLFGLGNIGLSGALGGSTKAAASPLKIS